MGAGVDRSASLPCTPSNSLPPGASPAALQQRRDGATRRAQWCRRMEDTRLDVDCRYLDADGAAVSFDEVFVRSQALEHAVASVRPCLHSDAPRGKRSVAASGHALSRGAAAGAAAGGARAGARRRGADVPLLTLPRGRRSLPQAPRGRPQGMRPSRARRAPRTALRRRVVLTRAWGRWWASASATAGGRWTRGLWSASWASSRPSR